MKITLNEYLKNGGLLENINLSNFDKSDRFFNGLDNNPERVEKVEWLDNKSVLVTYKTGEVSSHLITDDGVMVDINIKLPDDYIFNPDAEN